MSLWPFRRKSRRRRPDDRRGRQSDPLPHSLTAPGASLRADNSRRQTTEGNKLQRRARTYSFSPGRDDSIRARGQTSAKGRRNTKPPMRSATDTYPSGSPDHNKELGEKDIDSDMFGRVPTLHNKRDGQHLMPRKKSSKRRKNDHDREAEIKAMSNFMPLRPATEEWLAGRPMKRDTRRVRTGLTLGFRGSARHEWDKENRSSDISLPLADSIHSTMSSDSEHISFKVSALEALAPRPTLRYASYPRWGPASDAPGPIPARVSSQRRKLSERGPITESTLKAHKRIDDLADELDASDLRELMERDKRRRERKRQTDQEKLERRLARRAEKQKAEAATGQGVAKNLERGVLGRDATGLGVDPASAVITSTRRRSPNPRPKASETFPEDGSPATHEGSEAQSPPVNAFHRTTSIPLETSASAAEHEAAVSKPSPSPKALELARSKKSRSKSSFTLDEKAEISDSLRKGSETGGSRGPMSWMSFFRWTNRARRDSEGPSSFSNTSRDSMQTTPLPTPSANYISQQKPAGVPKRTMSRFREDLPETALLSPPVSRVQSPEADIVPRTIEEASPDGDHKSGDEHAPIPRNSHIYGASGSPRESMEAMRETPSTFSRPDEAADGSPRAQNMSLASIDSEASWLSGRIGSRRRSSARTQPPHRLSSSNPSPTADNDPAREDDSIVDDEYLSRLTPLGHEPAAWARKSVGEGRPSSDEGEDARWGSVKGQVPTVVQTHTAERMKSREGLLNSFGEEAESDDGQAIGEGISSPETPAEMQRATSINLGKGHVRNFSAGSAKLLNLTPRTSVDGKRRSVEPRSNDGPP